MSRDDAPRDAGYYFYQRGGYGKPPGFFNRKPYRSASAPDEALVTYGNGDTRVVHHSKAGTFDSRIPHPTKAVVSTCEEYLKCGVWYLLHGGPECQRTATYASALERFCDIRLSYYEPEDGSTSTGCSSVRD